MINKAMQVAEEKHRGQKRKFTNEPYIVHPLSVANIVKKYKNSHRITELITAAILHDTLEDTNIKEEDLKTMFNELTVSLVKELTTDEEEKNKLGKKIYLANKMIKMSNWALVIKLADRLDNLAPGTPEEWRNNYIKDTKYILEELERHRELSKTHKILIEKIQERIKWAIKF